MCECKGKYWNIICMEKLFQGARDKIHLLPCIRPPPYHTKFSKKLQVQYCYFYYINKHKMRYNIPVNENVFAI